MPKASVNSILLPKQATVGAGDSTHVHLYAKTNGVVGIKNADNFERPINVPIFFNSLVAVFPAAAQANTTRVDVTGWTIPVIAGISYEIKILATYTTAAGGTGGSMGIITSGGAAGNIHGYYSADITNGTVATGLRAPLTQISTVNTLANSFMTSSGAAGTDSFECNAIFNCTTSGNLIVQWGTEIALSGAFLRAGSTLIARNLN